MGKHSIKRKIWREIYRNNTPGILPEWLIWLIVTGLIVAAFFWLR